jgi:hypothetical protein
MKKPTSWVYFLRSGETGPIKIGYTGTTPNARLSALQTGNPEPLRLIGAVPGTMADESRLHDRFSGARIQGEWFRPVPELLAFIEGALFGCREMPGSYDDMVDRENWLDTVAEYSRLQYAVDRVEALETCDGVAEMDGGVLHAHSLDELRTHLEVLRYAQVVHGDGMLRVGEDRLENAIEQAERICSRQGAMYGFTQEQVAFLGKLLDVREWNANLREAFALLRVLRRNANSEFRGDLSPAPLPLPEPTRRAVAVAWSSGVRIVGAFFADDSVDNAMLREAYGASYSLDLEPVKGKLLFLLGLLLGSENPPPASVIPNWLQGQEAEAA